MKTGHRKGMTLVELMVASILSITVLTGVLTLTTFVQTVWRNERVNSKVLIDLEIAMERIQKELRFTDLNRIYYYPEEGPGYTAISFPRAIDDDRDGVLETDDTTRTIIWDETVIYHIYTNGSGKKELRRTVFDPRHELSDEDFQAQIDDVATNGQPDAGTPGYEEWDEENGTRTLLTADDITLNISKTARQFDGYAASTTRSDNTKFGSIRLASGAHHITFNVAGKNSEASSPYYRMGIDSFSISPSGASREAEEATIDSTGDGAASVNQEMTGYGSWSGNRHLEYRSTTNDDWIKFDFTYDQWIETNFATSSPSETIREYSNRTGNAGITSGDNEYYIRLPGYGTAWTAAGQTGASGTSPTVSLTGNTGYGVVFRNVVLSRNIDVEGRAAKITFYNASSGSITIDYASLMTRQSGPNGTNIIPATFNNEGTGLPKVLVIGAGSSGSSDWIDLNNFDRSKDYLLTFHIATSATSLDMSAWNSGDVSENCYWRLDALDTVADDPTWTSGTYTTSAAIYSAGLITASYFSGNINGGEPATITSQIYDTGYVGHAYEDVSWRIAANNYGDYGLATPGLGANLVLKVRSGQTVTGLQADNGWTTNVVTINTVSATTGTESISDLSHYRYVQFRAEFFSRPTAGSSDYTKSCVLKSVSVDWPGDTRVVDVNGCFTKRPNYGIFTVSVDGYELSKTLEVDLGVTYNTSGGKEISKSMSAEIEPRNTGR